MWYNKEKTKERGIVMKQKFFRCSVCGQIVAMVKETGSPLVCCGKKMEEIVPGTVDAAVEKHLPVYETIDGKVVVSVGEVVHPMSAEHYIEWISIQTDKGNQRKILSPLDKPEAKFVLLDGEKIEAVYAYCNLHGLWKN